MNFIQIRFRFRFRFLNSNFNPSLEYQFDLIELDFGYVHMKKVVTLCAGSDEIKLKTSKLLMSTDSDREGFTGYDELLLSENEEKRRKRRRRR